MPAPATQIPRTSDTALPENSSNPAWGPWLVFAVLFALFLGFPSRSYDGDALKRLGILFNSFHLEGSNHPYTNAYFLGWWTLVKGLAPTDIIGRIDTLVAMNSLLGAGAAALGSAWLGCVGAGRIPSVLGGFLLGLGSASVYHSTQTTEPISAQFWLMLSLFVGAQSRLGAWSGILAGICWATSVASYQSYFLAGPFLLWLHARRWRDTIPWIATAGATGIFWFGLAAHLNGKTGVSGFIEYLTTKHDGDYWGFFGIGQTARVPIGFASAVAIPWPSRHWPGLLAGFAQLSWVWKILCVSQILLLWLLAGAALVARPRNPLQLYRWPLLLGFAACTFPPLYLSPHYWKLWLLPVALIQLLGVLVASGRNWGPWALAGALSIQIAANVPRLLIEPHQKDSTGLRAAEAIEGSLRKTDLLICDRWSDAGFYCATHPDQNLLNLMSHLSGSEGLWTVVRSNLASGNRVFIYGVVQRTPERWKASDLGTRPHLITHDEVLRLRPFLSPPVWQAREKGTLEDLYEITTSPPR